MMGLPHGWVAGLLPHGPALKACGNGVVPQQAVTAIEWLLDLDLTPEPDSDCLTLGGLR